MIIGILFVIAACLCWGLIFPIPKMLAGFNPLEVSLGRYFFFGATSFALLLLRKRHLLKRDFFPFWMKALLFALLSTIISYSLLVACIHYSTPAAAALIFGMSPITIALSGNWYRKEYSFRSFLFSLLLIATGIILANFSAFTLGGIALGPYFFGLLCGILSLGSWTWYTIANFHFLGKHPQMPSNDWVTMMGVASFFLVLLTGGAYSFVCPDLAKYCQLTQSLGFFLLGTLILGTVSTWVSFFFWNCANRRLPVSLAGQLMVFEMIFGLFFVYLVEKRLPFPLEIAGIVVMLLGVITAFKTLKKLSLPVP